MLILMEPSWRKARRMRMVLLARVQAKARLRLERLLVLLRDARGNQVELKAQAAQQAKRTYSKRVGPQALLSNSADLQAEEARKPNIK